MIDKAVLVKEAKWVLSDYFGVAVPDEWLLATIKTDPELEQEILQGAVSDTCVREMLIHCICRELKIQVNVPNVFSFSGSYGWPCFGDSDEYKTEFYKQLNEKLALIGGVYNG